MAGRRADPAFTWDAARRRYRDPGGRYLARSAVDKAVARAVDSGAADAESLARRLQAGTIDVAAWQRGTARAIKLAHSAAAMAAAGGRANMTAREWGEVGARLREQYRYLRDFAGQVERGEAPMDGRFLARCRMYARSATVTYNAVSRRLDAAAGFDEERRVLNSGHPCGDCPGYAALGWQPIGRLPLPTRQCECLTNCKCSMERRRSGAAPPVEPRPPRFGPSDAPVGLAADPGYEDMGEALAHAAKVVGRPVTPADLASLAGAPDGADVRLEKKGADAVGIAWRTASARAERRIWGQPELAARLGLDPRPILFNDELEVEPAERGKGLGRSVLGRQIEAASRLGFSRIKTIAAGSAKMRSLTGYKVWPRLGYDAPLRPGTGARLPEGLAHCERVSDLMRSPEGRQWWDDHGATTAMEFDLAPGSLSRRVWEASLAKTKAE